MVNTHSCTKHWSDTNCFQPTLAHTEKAVSQPDVLCTVSKDLALYLFTDADSEPTLTHFSRNWPNCACYLRTKCRLTPCCVFKCWSYYTSKNAMFSEYPHNFKCDIDVIHQFNKKRVQIMMFYICERICGFERIVSLNDPSVNTATCFVTEWMNDSVTHLKHYLFYKDIYKGKKKNKVE